MKINLVKQLGVLLLGLLLVACQNSQADSGESGSEVTVKDSMSSESHDHSYDHDESQENLETVTIEGVQEHYHTGGLIELVAVMDEDVDHNHWHWFTRKDESGEWEAAADQNTNEFIYEAPEESFEVRAVLYSDDHEVYAQSVSVEIIVDNH